MRKAIERQDLTPNAPVVARPGTQYDGGTVWRVTKEESVGHANGYAKHYTLTQEATERQTKPLPLHNVRKYFNRYLPPAAA